MAWTCPSCGIESVSDLLLRCACGYEVTEEKNQILYDAEKKFQELGNEEIINNTSSTKSNKHTFAEFINNYTAKESSYKFSISLFWVCCLLLIGVKCYSISKGWTKGDESWWNYFFAMLIAYILAGIMNLIGFFSTLKVENIKDRKMAGMFHLILFTFLLSTTLLTIF